MPYSHLYDKLLFTTETIIFMLCAAVDNIVIIELESKILNYAIFIYLEHGLA